MLLSAFMSKTLFLHPWDNRAINGNNPPGPCVVWSSITQPASQTADRPTCRKAKMKGNKKDKTKYIAFVLNCHQCNVNITATLQETVIFKEGR